MIYQIQDAVFVASSRGTYLPGSYDSRRAAHYAFRFPDSVLWKLHEAVRRGGPSGAIGVITFEMLQKARRKD